MIYNIAIDGPAGAGKSTIAKLVAKKRGYIYVDTGAMYRAMALYFLETGIKADEQEKISHVVDRIDVTITYENGEQIVWLNGRNVNGMIRTEEVSRMASATSVNSDVRAKLVELQRKLASKENKFIRVYIGVFKKQFYMSVSNSTDQKKRTKKYLKYFLKKY
mgnify:CR=1 FL=1